MAENLTIDDIAEALGVSKTTVSRAISGKGRISAATTTRVKDYISRIHYKPNAVARGLAQQRTFNIGVVCPTDYDLFDLPYFHKCLRGIGEVTSEKGYDILMSLITGSEISNLKRMVEDRKVDGVILTRTMFDDPPAEYLKAAGIPFVVIGSSPDKELVQVDNDHLDACCELTQILIGKGFRRLVLFGKDETQVITDTRKKGFTAAFESAGLKADPSMLYMGVNSEQAAEHAVADAMRRGAQGIVCMDDMIASLVMAACRRKRIRVPGDIRVASFYNSALLTGSDPAVTAIDIDDRKLGGTAAVTLLQMIDGEQPGSTLLRDYQIILRESTK